jgi:hypothetical protein
MKSTNLSLAATAKSGVTFEVSMILHVNITAFQNMEYDLSFSFFHPEFGSTKF